MPVAKAIDLGFTTADATRPVISYERGNVIISFVDWREAKVKVVFQDVVRFEWSDEPDDYFDGEPLDGTCVVRNSGWVPRSEVKCRHLRLNFNDCGGRLDIACGSVKVTEG